MKTLKEILNRVEQLEEIRDPQKFCKVGTPDEIAAMTEAERSQYQIIMIETSECSP